MDSKVAEVLEQYPQAMDIISMDKNDACFKNLLFTLNMSQNIFKPLT